MNKKGLQFKVIIEEGEEGYLIASVLLLPGCYTQAKTLPTLKKELEKQYYSVWRLLKRTLYTESKSSGN